MGNVRARRGAGDARDEGRWRTWAPGEEQEAQQTRRGIEQRTSKSKAGGGTDGAWKAWVRPTERVLQAWKGVEEAEEVADLVLLRLAVQPKGSRAETS